MTVVEFRKADDGTLDRTKSGEDWIFENKKSRQESVRLSVIPLKPLHDMRKIRGPIDQLLSPQVYESADRNDYLHVTLTDQKEILDAIGRLRDVYPNIMRLDFEAGKQEVQEAEEVRLEEKTPEELFAEFFLRQNGFEMSDEQRELVSGLWKGGETL